VSRRGAHLEIVRNGEAAARVGPAEVVRLTQAATGATFYHDGLSVEQIEATERVPVLSGEVFFEAAAAEQQHLAAAFDGERLGGFVIATRHAPGDLELDWLMVDPALHGSGLAAMLMEEGLAWLGFDQPVWLTVIRHNQRAIGFYRKFDFAIDETALLARPVPTWIMRRHPGPLRSVSLAASGHES
jgi:ribosomal protein S18 acetylase RimI-like enzyme